MAEVRHYAGRGVHNFALKMLNYYLLGSQMKHGKGAVHASSLLAGFFPDDTENCGRNRAHDTANRLTEVCQGSYTGVKHLLGAGLRKGNDTKNVCNHGLKELSRSSNNRIQLGERNVPRYRTYIMFWRTFSNSFRGHPGPCFQCFYQRSGPFVFIREYSGSGTRTEPLYRTKTGYYDVLGVSTSASQAQIKTAYYKQSFVYHPDRNSGSDEATARFSEISEAYTVLGNKALRKKYDRGLLSLSDLTAPVRPSAKDSAGGSAKPQAQSRRTVAGTDFRGGGGFDFDKFYKFHYSEQLQRERNIRARREEMKRMKQDTKENNKLVVMMEFGTVILLLFAMGVLLTL